jgi:hypothetical protein
MEDALHLHIKVLKTNRLMLFREVIAVYCENHTKRLDTVGKTDLFFYYESRWYI